jgi:hypothetical protein
LFKYTFIKYQFWKTGKSSPKSLWGMPQRDYWWCIIVAKYGAFLFTENGAVVITDYKAFQ